jgi:hypothetical protein
MTKFDDNLWREVEAKYGPELSQGPGPIHSRSRLRRPVVAGTSLGIVGAGTAAVVILTAASSSPAFAVTTHPNGTVSVVIRRIEGIPGANRRLAELGIHARAVSIADGCHVLPPPGALRAMAVTTLVRNGHSNWVIGRVGTIRAEIRPAQIPSGRTWVIPAVRAGAVVRLVRGRAVPGAVPACLPPTVKLWSASGIVRTIACRGGIPLHPVPGRIVVRPPVSAAGTGTNTTATDAGPSPATVTQTTVSPTTTTDSGTATNSATATNSGTATNADTTTAGATTPSSTAPGSATPKFPPPLLRACRLAARAAQR